MNPSPTTVSVGAGFIPARGFPIIAGCQAKNLGVNQRGINSTGTGIKFQVKPESPAG